MLMSSTSEGQDRWLLRQIAFIRRSGSYLNGARWSADGDVILAGPPWHAWRAPSWEEIAAAEAEDKAEIQRP